ncbi:ATP-dependent RNA helicase chl1 [Diplogelasinospora grovesii]|uniref:ATP-dependent DNA helicase CHL1 n=1 Tax=Diplogelasinospora grovesii TaxID=303347 RepID=A0AAN6N205_9PEZI|nr:ATP-dependent RNA helicase chl1 [Diplogelasinospora grovesii]
MAADKVDAAAELDFHHPFTPYDVQLEFMRAVYSVLETGDGQVGILESPTGTGKSLSLICAALTWLRNHKRGKYESSFNAVADGMQGEPDWMIELALKRKREELTRTWEEREQQLNKIRQRERVQEDKGRGNKRQRVDHSDSDRKGAVDEEKEFLISDWHDTQDEDNIEGEATGGLSKETRDLMEKVGLGGYKRREDEKRVETEDEIKIYYTSRTHSQLTQFISELRRPTFPPSIPQKTDGGKDEQGEREGEVVKQLPLSSRQKLCINPGVARLGSLSAINDRCAELQQSKSTKCAFMPDDENLKATHQFRDTVLATLPDIEDVYRIGKEMQVCPYYASRTAIPGAEVITLPYPLLLQKSARDALGIKLEGNVVIIDEAHNIMDAVANVHAAEIRLSELRRARQMLGVYVKRFGKKLQGENRIMVAHVGRVVESLTEFLDTTLTKGGNDGIADTNLLLKARGADQINLYKIIRYIQESKLAYKVESYVAHAEEQASDPASVPRKSTPVLHTLVSFLTALTNLSNEGRIFYEKLQPTQSGIGNADIKLSYLLLSPTHAFSSIANSARAVILAGGTMTPFEDYTAHLFPTLPPTKITTLSCGHVIPKTNLCVWALGSTLPSPTHSNALDPFMFTFSQRSDKKMIRSLGLTLLNVCSAVPDGVVMFFPSYGYLDEVVAVWQTAEPNTKSLWDRLALKKTVFRESKGGSSDDTLQEYTQAILDPPKEATTRGALLLSVVGGKMSEGINFSDRLGRCVLIVGLPYPNSNSPEWKARLEYIESSTLSRLTDSGTDKGRAVEEAKQASRDFYENACMRAVNQSIGRAIRHRNDYAAIVLIDKRFGTRQIKQKLPKWIRSELVEGSQYKGLQGLMGALSGFFRGKRGT